jgi:hypothetical protein
MLKQTKAAASGEQLGVCVCDHLINILSGMMHKRRYSRPHPLHMLDACLQISLSEPVSATHSSIPALRPAFP